MKEIYLHSKKERIPGNPTCPKCKRRVDGATGVSETEPRPEPEPGNLGVCLYCGSLNRYTANLHLEPVDRTERRKILRRDPKLRELVELVESTSQQIRRQWQ